jgi:hypothetical protein
LSSHARATFASLALCTIAIITVVASSTGCESADHEMKRHYQSATEEQQYIDKAIAIVRARSDAFALGRKYSDGTWTADSDVSLVNPDYPMFCPGEYVVRLQISPGVDGESDPSWYVDVRSSGTDREQTDAAIDVLIARDKDASDVEHHFLRAENASTETEPS